MDKIGNIFINLPKEAAFDTYSLKQDLQDEIKSGVENEKNHFR